MTRLIAGCALLVSLAVVAMADDSSRLSLSVRGQSAGSDTFMSLSVTLRSGVTKAVRVYSQPSGTLLGVFANSGADEPVPQSAWYKQTFPVETRGARFPAASFDFAPGVTSNIRTIRPPSGDTYLDIYVYGLWPSADGKSIEERDDVFTVHANPTKFSFTLTKKLESTQICCGDNNYPDGSCKYDCETCASNRSLWCCYETDETCGWCSRNKASCGICPSC